MSDDLECRPKSSRMIVYILEVVGGTLLVLLLIGAIVFKVVREWNIWFK